MKLDLDATCNADEPRIYEAVATLSEPCTDEGDDEDVPPERLRENQSRLRAIQFATDWAKRGYWGAVYNQLTGEKVVVYSPTRTARR